MEENILGWSVTSTSIPLILRQKREIIFSSKSAISNDWHEVAETVSDSAFCSTPYSNLCHFWDELILQVQSAVHLGIADFASTRTDV